MPKNKGRKRRNKFKSLKTEGSISSFNETQKPLSEEIATRKNAESYLSILSFLPNPDRVLRKQGKDVEIYRDLRSDAKVQAVLGTRKAGVKAYRASVNDNGADARLVELVEDLLRDSWDAYSLIDEILEASEFGYKPFEILWEEKNGFIVPTAFPKDEDGEDLESESPGLVGKPSEWFQYSNDNKLLFKRSRDFQGTPVPPKKFIVARRKPTYSNPYGEAILSAVFWPVVFKKNGLKFWNLFVEKYGMPFLVGKYPRGAKVPEQDALLDSLEEMIQDAVAAIPDGSSVDVIERKGGSGNQEFKQIAEFMDKQIAQAILGQNLTSDVSSGSLAAAEVHQEVKDEIVNDDSKIVQKFFDDVFKLIRDVNFPNSRAPRLNLSSPEGIDKDLADRDKTLTETGVKFSKSYFMKAHNLSEDDFEVEGESSSEGKIESPGGEFSEETDPEFKDQNAVDHFVDSFKAGDFQEFADELLAPVFRIIEESKDYSEAMEQISEAYPEMSSERLEDVIGKAIFTAESFGATSREE